ncbi:ammonium transporter [Pyrus ussuriensis x Pyrus communis]|uniref:Ammonium transporter n=1 Tax=Pyrus ussuriensis x Pyrus communis TaxID=2448454 RepID=A0A5N5HYF8_9ROSA|nr:ammonium transporter [Pyrus ussuriensis x Pyrus communis]
MAGIINAYSAITLAVPPWLNKCRNTWQLTAATFVGLQSMSGLVILYASIVKKKWAVNSAFMALYAFTAVLICWVLVGYCMAFGDQLLPFWAKGAPSLDQKFLIIRAEVPESTNFDDGGLIETPTVKPFFPMASLVYFQFTFATITLILLAASILGQMNIKAWMAFVPLWLLFSYTVGAFSLWGGGFFYHWGVIDYSGDYVIHLSPGIAGFTAAYWVGPRLKSDRERFPPNNVLIMLCGFNGGAPYAANIVAPIAVLNTNIYATTSRLVWTSLDVVFFGKLSVIGAVQGMMTGLSWATILMAILSGSIPWVSMMVIHKKSTLYQKVDDTLGVFHTHAVARLLGGLLTGLLAEPALCRLILPVGNSRGAFYDGNGGMQFLKQLVAAMFVIAWNIVSTTFILLAIRVFIPLRMPKKQLNIGDDAVHGEEAYALWGDGEKYDPTRHSRNASLYGEEMAPSPYVNGARGVTINL